MQLFTFLYFSGVGQLCQSKTSREIGKTDEFACSGCLKGNSNVNGRPSRDGGGVSGGKNSRRNRR